MAVRAENRIATTAELGAATSHVAAAAHTRATRILLAALVVSDAVAVSMAFVAAYLLRFRTGLDLFYTPPDSPLRFYSTLVFGMVPMVLAVFAVYRLYSTAQLFDGPQEYIRITTATTVSLMLVVLFSFLFDSGLVIARGWIVISWAALIAFVGADRFLMRRVVYRWRRSGRLGKRVLIIGSGADAAELADRIRATPEIGLRVGGVIDPAVVLDASFDESYESPIVRSVSACGAGAVIVSAASVSQPALARIVRDLSGTDVDLQVVPGMYEILTTGVQVREVRGLPLVTMNKVRITGYDLLLKRTLDYTVTIGAVLVLSPLLAGIALAVRLTSPGPVLHRRRVIGEQGRRFDALKFRTMYQDGDAILRRHPELEAQLLNDGKLVDDPRITPVGRWLRRWSLDELPQLFNVLAGQMSLVGPRMITETELPRFGHWRENLSTVKPGLTGLWQVSGRSRLGYDDRVRLDMHYIRAYSIWTDVEILARTIPAVIRGVGAY